MNLLYLATYNLVFLIVFSRWMEKGGRAFTLIAATITIPVGAFFKAVHADELGVPYDQGGEYFFLLGICISQGLFWLQVLSLLQRNISSLLTSISKYVQSHFNDQRSEYEKAWDGDKDWKNIEVDDLESKEMNTNTSSNKIVKITKSDAVVDAFAAVLSKRIEGMQQKMLEEYEKQPSTNEVTNAYKQAYSASLANVKEKVYKIKQEFKNKHNENGI